MKRGAESCVFVEGVKARADDIRRRAGGSLVLSLEVRRAVSWLVKHSMKFTVIFADPPYSSGWSESLPALQNLDALFEPDTVMVMEQSSREPVTLSNNPHNLAITSTREYGETCLTFLQML